MTLKDAVNEAMREWVTRLDTTHYLIGSAIGPHPFPTIVRDFQRVIGREIKSQMAEKAGKLPDAVVACVGGGSNAIGTFYDFIEDPSVRLIGVEAGGHGIDTESHSGQWRIFPDSKSELTMQLPCRRVSLVLFTVPVPTSSKARLVNLLLLTLSLPVSLTDSPTGRRS
jgi:hypothetical protein